MPGMPLSPLVTAIPAELREGKRFVVWRMERRDGDPTKIPYCIDGRKARSDDPSTWGTIDDVSALYASGTFSGIGIMLAGGEVSCIDLDHCRDPETGVLDEPAAAVIAEVGSYTEVSPSGTGVHIFVFGTPPSGARRRGYVEMYGPNDNRYITLTGRSVDGKPLRALRQVDLPALHRKLFPHDEDDRTGRTTQSSSGASSCNLSDFEVIENAAAAGNGAKFRRLFVEDGEADYGSYSEARFALFSILAFWTQDEAQLFRLFERSALFRDDADTRRKVVDHDIPNAIRKTTNHYEPPSVGIGAITRSGNADDDRPVVVTTPEADFPFDTLPGALRSLALAGASATGAPAEAIAVHGLAVLGAALGGSARIRVGSWSQRPVLWTATVARPGTAKSTALRLAKKPLDDFDSETHEAWLAARKLDKLAVWKRTLADNVTVEKLARLLVENPRGLLIAADELAGLVAGMNQYKGGKGSDRQSYLQLWSVAALRVDRVTTDPIYLREPLVSITGGIQPDRLEMLRGGDGMTGRWLIAYLENRVREIPTDADISSASRAWKMLVDGLLRRVETIEYRLSPAAYVRYRELRDAEIIACNDETDPDFADWLGKFESHLARLTLVLWAAENESTVVHESFVDRAWKLVRYFADGAKAHVQTAVTDPTLKPWERGIDETVEKVRAWLARHPGKTWRDVQRSHVAGLRTVEAVKTARGRYEAVYGVRD